MSSQPSPVKSLPNQAESAGLQLTRHNSAQALSFHQKTKQAVNAAQRTSEKNAIFQMKKQETAFKKLINDQL